MKSLIGLTLALALVLSVAPVMAAESFEGMENLSSAVVALPDADLANVQGQGLVGDINVEINVAITTQLNNLFQIAVNLGDEAIIAQAGDLGNEAATAQR